MSIRDEDLLDDTICICDTPETAARVSSEIQRSEVNEIYLVETVDEIDSRVFYVVRLDWWANGRHEIIDRHSERHVYVGGQRIFGGTFPSGAGVSEISYEDAYQEALRMGPGRATR